MSPVQSSRSCGKSSAAANGRTEAAQLESRNLAIDNLSPMKLFFSPFLFLMTSIYLHISIIQQKLTMVSTLWLSIAATMEMTHLRPRRRSLERKRVINTVLYVHIAHDRASQSDLRIALARRQEYGETPQTLRSVSSEKRSVGQRNATQRGLVVTD
jgi:hypothetical protein